MNGGTIAVCGKLAVQVLGLSVVRRRHPILRYVRLEIATGETVLLVGHNGAGKSTLLKCMAGALKPNCGQMRCFGEDPRLSPRTRQRIGFAGHESGLYGELSVLENLLFAARMNGLERAQERAWSLLREARLENTSDRVVSRLSQGVKRRVAILRALVHDPALILLDEPFASLDDEGCQWLKGLFQAWRAANRTICLASHDTHVSYTVADRIVRLDAGQIASVKRPVNIAAKRA